MVADFICVCRKAALITSGVLLLLCGAAMMALPFYMAQLPEKALQKACQRVILNTNTYVRTNTNTSVNFSEKARGPCFACPCLLPYSPEVLSPHASVRPVSQVTG
jgi:hypothetical protein